MQFIRLFFTRAICIGALKLQNPTPKDLFVWSEGAPHELKESKSAPSAEAFFGSGQPASPKKSRYPDHWVNKRTEQEWQRDASGKEKSTLLLDPNRKLAFCYFPKVASNLFNILFIRLNHLDKHEFKISRFGAVSAERFGKNVGQEIGRDEISHEHGWKFAIFTRDPLSRFLSAFGSKCLPKSDGRPGAIRECGGIVGQGPPDGWPIIFHPAPVDDMVRAFEEYVVHFKTTLHSTSSSPHADRLLTNNRHYMRQVDLLNSCGHWAHIVGPVDFIGNLHGDVQAQVKAMLDLGRANCSTCKRSKDNHMAERFFPAESVRSQHNPAEYTTDVFYRNRSIKQMVFEMYKIDYDTFGIPYPEDFQEQGLWSKITKGLWIKRD